MFKAYFQETVQERWESVYHVREVNISFFLEDGTMKVVEPPVSNSGLEQGLTVHLFFVIFLSPSYRQQDTRHVFYLLLLHSLILSFAFSHFTLLSDGNLKVGIQNCHRSIRKCANVIVRWSLRRCSGQTTKDTDARPGEAEILRHTRLEHRQGARNIRASVQDCGLR